ncbi:MAG TPA: hypothetical protein VHJ19_02320 [Gammaproteobacteria bacterium]|jgi:hypothetical protein|nr:hypothetical protein [Gammaproteobacteria bacterium]
MTKDEISNPRQSGREAVLTVTQCESALQIMDYSRDSFYRL